MYRPRRLCPAGTNHHRCRCLLQCRYSYCHRWNDPLAAGQTSCTDSRFIWRRRQRLYRGPNAEAITLSPRSHTTRGNQNVRRRKFSNSRRWVASRLGLGGRFGRREGACAAIIRGEIHDYPTCPTVSVRSCGVGTRSIPLFGRVSDSFPEPAMFEAEKRLEGACAAALTYPGVQTLENVHRIRFSLMAHARWSKTMSTTTHGV
jgi:hypothetical protein